MKDTEKVVLQIVTASVDEGTSEPTDDPEFIGELEYPNTVTGELVRAMTPAEIVDVLTSLDPEDTVDIVTALWTHLTEGILGRSITEIEWRIPRREPPLVRRPELKWTREGKAHAAWVPFAEALVANPGRWAVFRRYPNTQVGWNRANSTAASIGRTGSYRSHGLLKAFEPLGSFESLYRVEGDQAIVYARYIGG